MDASQMQPGRLQRRLVSLAAFAVLVACGGGGGDASIAARQESQPSACSSITHLDVTVTAARPGRAGGEQVQVLSSARTIDLMTTSTGVLQALGLAPLASGDAAQVRLVTTDGTVRFSTGATASLKVPGGTVVSASTQVPAGALADLVV